MAEGDSIARLAARMHARTAGATITRSEFRHPRWATADLSGQTITGWHPRGKHLLMRTDAGWTLHSHLRMSGSWSVLRPGSRHPRDLRVALWLDDRRAPPDPPGPAVGRARPLAESRVAAGVALPVLTLVRTRDEGRVVGHLGPDLLGEAPDLDAAAARLRADPELAPAFVEEILRFDSPVQLTTRFTSAPLDLGDGLRLDAGASLTMLLGSANRDPARYPDPHRFDPDRPAVQPVSFGGGAHYCLGAPLARLEAQVAFPMLLTMLPGLAVDGEPQLRDRLVLRGFATLPVVTG